MKPSCRQIESLIDRRAQGLSEAERLTLEQHLIACAACHEMERMMRLVHRVTDAAPAASLSEATRSRVITSALSVSSRQSAARAPRSRWLVPLPAAAAAAAAAWVGFGLLSQAPSAEQATLPRPVAVAASKSKPVVEPSSAQQPSHWIDAQEEQTLLFADSSVTLKPGTRARLDPESQVVQLAEGTLEIDAPAGKAAHVVTQHLRVEMLGSRAILSEDWITVERGSVEVSSLDGKARLRRVAAGTRLTLQELLSGKAPEPSPNVESLLTGARKALAAGDVDTARDLTTRVERAGPQRRQRAELDTLRAECFLLERNRGAAIEQYLHVAERYGELSAGDNALYAATQLVERAGDRPRAQMLLKRYLDRYPHGRFTDEAKNRLLRAQ